MTIATKGRKRTQADRSRQSSTSRRRRFFFFLRESLFSCFPSYINTHAPSLPPSGLSSPFCLLPPPTHCCLVLLRRTHALVMRLHIQWPICMSLRRHTEDARGVTLGDIGKAITALDEVVLGGASHPTSKKPLAAVATSDRDVRHCPFFSPSPPFRCRQSSHAVASHTFLRSTVSATDAATARAIPVPLSSFPAPILPVVSAQPVSHHAALAASVSSSISSDSG